jgi:hypothetical protein
MGEGRHGVQKLSIEVESSESAFDLFSVLSRFGPRWSTDAEGRNFVSVQLGGERRALALLDTLNKHLAERAPDEPVTSTTVAVDEISYSVHDR